MRRRERLGRPTYQDFQGAIFKGFPRDKEDSRKVVPENIIDALSKNSWLYHYEREAIAFHQNGDEEGEPNTQLHFVVDGAVQIEGRYEGRIIHARIARAGIDEEYLFGEYEALHGNPKPFLGTPNLATTWALTESKILQIEYADFLKCGRQDENSCLFYNLNEWLAKRIFKNLKDQLIGGKARSKELLYDYLNGLIQQGQEANGILSQSVTTEDLMEAAGGISRQWLYQLLKNAKESDEYEFDSRNHKIKLGKNFIKQDVKPVNEKP